jgi:hypothetical protein
MAKSRRKVRKAAKRPAKKRAAKRKTVAKAKRRPAKKKTRKAKPRKQTSIIDSVAETVHETGELRQRLAGPNTFED